MLYYVPYPLHFVWPTIEIGHTVTLDYLPKVDGFDERIQLETMSNRPRVFRLKNFISDKEVDELLAITAAANLTRSTGGLGKDDSSEQNSGEISETRTSTNTCDVEEKASQRKS